MMLKADKLCHHLYPSRKALWDNFTHETNQTNKPIIVFKKSILGFWYTPFYIRPKYKNLCLFRQEVYKSSSGPKPTKLINPTGLV